ncbi:MAG: hypothetical protein HY023_08475 [Chloroflexi bacterium]|nr:hypothetical protein [Chloroflexota bacterium]MBI3762057.1 hypothetical protein [Chloroflexota bacterium]
MSTPPAAPPSETGLTPRQRLYVIIAAIAGLGILAFVIVAIIYMVNNPAQTVTIRDIFIIVMSVESLVIGVALIVLIVQLAQLTNLLRHEIKPILDSTNETVNTVRGTTIFLSENLVEPVVKLNSYVAALERFIEGLSLFIPRR